MEAQDIRKRSVRTRLVYVHGVERSDIGMPYARTGSGASRRRTAAIRSTSVKEVPDVSTNGSSTSDQATREAMEAQIAALLDSQKVLADQLAAIRQAF